MRILIILSILTLCLFGGEFKLKKWQKSETFGAYLNRHNIDSTLIYNKIDPNDIKFLSTIESGATFFENIENGILKETLIPLSEEMQIDIKKTENNYKFDIIPIKYKIIKDTLSINIENSCFLDLKRVTNNPNIATYLKKIFKNYVDFTKLQKGDTVAIDYEQKSINGIPWGDILIKSAYIKQKKDEYLAIKKRDNYAIYSNTNSFVKRASKKSNYLTFANPIKVMRVTSKFTHKRWHPILHRYRPHLGIDIGAKKGTPIYAVSSGKIIYAGWVRGYGRVTKIAHGAGFVSLYAHQSRQYVKAGQRVKRHQVIGAVGSTGRSTGSHLHLGIYKRGRAINPFRVLGKKIKIGSGVIKRAKVIIRVKKLNKELPYKDKKVYNMLIKISPKNSKPFVWKNLTKKSLF